MVEGAEALYAKIPKIAPSPLEAAMAANDAETSPADAVRNMVPPSPFPPDARLLFL